MQRLFKGTMKFLGIDAKRDHSQEAQQERVQKKKEELDQQRRQTVAKTMDKVEQQAEAKREKQREAFAKKQSPRSSVQSNTPASPNRDSKAQDQQEQADIALAKRYFALDEQCYLMFVVVCNAIVKPLSDDNLLRNLDERHQGLKDVLKRIGTGCQPLTKAEAKTIKDQLLKAEVVQDAERQMNQAYGGFFIDVIERLTNVVTSKRLKSNDKFVMALSCVKKAVAENYPDIFTQAEQKSFKYINHQHDDEYEEHLQHWKTRIEMWFSKRVRDRVSEKYGNPGIWDFAIEKVDEGNFMSLIHSAIRHHQTMIERNAKDCLLEKKHVEYFMNNAAIFFDTVHDNLKIFAQQKDVVSFRYYLGRVQHAFNTLKKEGNVKESHIISLTYAKEDALKHPKFTEIFSTIISQAGFFYLRQHSYFSMHSHFRQMKEIAGDLIKKLTTISPWTQILNTLIKKFRMKAEASQGSVVNYVNYLNRSPTSEHYGRTLGLLIQYVLIAGPVSEYSGATKEFQKALYVLDIPESYLTAHHENGCTDEAIVNAFNSIQLKKQPLEKRLVPMK